MTDNKARLLEEEGNYSAVKRYTSHNGHFDIVKEDLM